MGSASDAGAGAYGGSVTFVVLGCVGASACSDIAKGKEDGTAPGSIEGIDDSCQGSGACKYVAKWGGSVCGITRSCKGTNACKISAVNGSGDICPFPFNYFWFRFR